MVIPDIPHITQGLFPLSDIVDAFSRNTLKQLVQLADILPSLSNVDKKRQILQWLIQYRGYAIRILVLSRWAGVAPLVNRCIDVVAYLQGQKFCYQNLIYALQDIRYQLSFARVRNSDLLTAVDVLSSGTYPRLLQTPTSNAYLVPDEEISAKEALKALDAIHATLRLRLHLHETIPRPFRDYEIRDGRCIFVVPNEFSVALSTTSDNIRPENLAFQWFLVDFDFLLPSTSPSTITPERYKNLIEQHLNEQLAVALLNKLPALPLVYDILHRCCLYLRLNLLHQQLEALSRDSWAGHLIGTLNEQTSTLRIKYWPKLKISKDGKVVTPDFEIIISVLTQEPTAYERLLSTRTSSAEYDHSKLNIVWQHDGTSEPISIEEPFESQDLLMLVTKKHAAIFFERIQSNMNKSILSELREDGLVLQMMKHRILLKVNSITGRLVLLDEQQRLAPARYLRAAENTIAAKPDLAAQTLNRLRLFCIQAQMIELSQCARLHVVRGYLPPAYLTFTRLSWHRPDHSVWMLAFHVETLHWFMYLTSATGKVLFSQRVHTTGDALSIQSFSRLAHLVHLRQQLYEIQLVCESKHMRYSYMLTPPGASFQDTFSEFVQTSLLCIEMPEKYGVLYPMVFVRASENKLVFDGRIHYRTPQGKKETSGDCTVDWRVGRFTVQSRNFDEFEKQWVGLSKLAMLAVTTAFEVVEVTLHYVKFRYGDTETFQVSVLENDSFKIQFFNPQSCFHMIAHLLQGVLSDSRNDVRTLRNILDRTHGILIAQSMGFIVLVRSLRSFRILLAPNHGLQVTLSRSGAVIQDLSIAKCEPSKNPADDEALIKWAPCAWLNSVWEGDMDDDELNGQVEASPESCLLRLSKDADLSAVIKHILMLTCKLKAS
ncbi:mediator complex subunit Pmc1 [Schizosaccharomyces japonicus yFS275]|uniref:Mediator of RNA polymerase II transcription subunit 14 n=1 Tax=Schizosaccharomyces japonicus (strain yFS275 / FY16936) TaxID=402676 RepID=B6K4L0_SCHJY|nr:mediator complex subunit Pmc1 [Schizosaccharomyces japonicus yFS275]EEB08417.1 mediator complex subunit Pmc1 [Schizosaccharomyces japonicus yFS275]